MAKVLEVIELAKSFGGVQAVNNLSFDLSEGQLLAMIGPNGAGKSTCFNLINGQLRPDFGRVVIMGKKINAQFHFGGPEFEWTQEAYDEVRPYIASVSEQLGYELK